MAVVDYAVANGRILSENRAGTRRTYRADALGSTIALYDNSQTRTDTFTYWPYGEIRTSSGSTGTKYKYVGTLGCRTQADGGIYMRARVLQPKDGRWLSIDFLWPVESAYVYALSSPIMHTDASGHQVLVCLIHYAFCAECAAAGLSSPPANWGKDFKDSIDKAIEKYCGKTCPNLSRKTLRCQIWAESGGDPNAVGSVNKNARGLFQIGKDIWNLAGCDKDLGPYLPNVWDPKKNIECAIRWLCKYAPGTKNDKGQLIGPQCEPSRWGTVTRPGSKFDCCMKC